MKVYYAHGMNLYDTPQEVRDIALLMRLGFDVINPNNPDTAEGIKKFKTRHPGENSMQFFESIIYRADILAFRAHIDGKIPSGVGYEIQYAKKIDKPIFELPNLIFSRFMIVEETRQYLEYLGQR